MEAAKVLLVTTEDESGDCLLLIATEEDKDEAGNGTVLVAMGDVRLGLPILDMGEVTLAVRDNDDLILVDIGIMYTLIYLYTQ